MRLAIILGTRPEIIKMSPILRACRDRRLDHFVLHTGQHYSYEMDRVFFEQLELADPDYNLDVGSGLHGAQTAKMLAGIENVLHERRPTEVLVQGDTNTVLAGALAASKLRIKVGHVEAGLRSFDRSMPEETNRIVADHISDHLFAPTDQSATYLRKEGLPDDRIFVTGNTIVDAVLSNREIAARRAKPLSELGVSPRNYVLMTAHRQENVDHPERFQSMLDGANAVGKELGVPVLYPIHPRSRKMVDQLGINGGDIRLLDPLDFMTFLQAEANASLVLTDSGGVQEETCILGVPCVTLRDNTERPETIAVGANRLAGVDASRILAASRDAVSRTRNWKNPFGAGDASRRILEIVQGA